MLHYIGDNTEVKQYHHKFMSRYRKQGHAMFMHRKDPCLKVYEWAQSLVSTLIFKHGT